MALWDHVGEDEPNSAWSRRDSRATAGVEPPIAAFLRSDVNPPRSSNDNRRSLFEDGPAYELDCLRHMLAPQLLRRAETRGRELGIGADQVLIHWGVLDEAAYLQRLSFHTGIEIEDFSGVDRDDCPLNDEEILSAATHGIIQFRATGRLISAFAPRRLTTRALCQLIEKYPAVKPNLRLMTASNLQQFLTRQCGPVLANKAARGLTEKYPSMSAAPIASESAHAWHRLRRGLSVAALALVPALLMGSAWSGMLAAWFILFVSLRVVGSLWPRQLLPELPRLSDGRLPVYTVIAALYREASSVAPLLQAINALDYPKEKLDVILVIEPDDLHTRAAIARLGPMSHVQILIAPDSGPKTKPKALNFALPFARGNFIAVFDAEDRPEAGQLRAALNAFRQHTDDVACAQAALCIDNKTNNWLSRMFEAEYAGQFDIYLPGLAAMGLPLPLGGSSNHFRTAALREAGGWDAYNVTEDADLGFRLARFGYRSVTFASTTFEEAPVTFGAWRRQRTRWMKGWVQTWLVHMRHPVRLWRDVGPLGFLALNILVGGNIISALSLPLLLYVSLAQVVAGTLANAPLQSYLDWPTPLHIAAIAAGFSSTILVGLMGLARRGRLRRGWILALTLPYWICLSAAAWRAVWQYVWKPYEWEKTEHGVADRNSSPMPHAGPPATSAFHQTRQR